MNKLPLEKRVQIVTLLVEGNSMRATSRITGVSINTVTKLLVDIGKACQKFHDEKVVRLMTKRVQCDEIWSFVYSKERNVPEGKEEVAGDVWTWVGIDADSKLVVSWLVGARDAECAHIFMLDIARRLLSRVQLTTDGLKKYLDAVEQAFGPDVDYAQLIKLYGETPGKTVNERRYSPAECVGIDRYRVVGNPDKKHISTSFVERQNLTMRMHMRRFTRLTNGFSKKFENHAYAVALHFVYYNFCRIHKTLRVTPAMEAEITDDIMEVEDLVKLIENQ